MAKKIEHKYVVGYTEDSKVVFGKDNSVVRLCTLRQAKRELGTLHSKCPKTIYELKPLGNLAVKVRLGMMVKS